MKLTEWSTPICSRYNSQLYSSDLFSHRENECIIERCCVSYGFCMNYWTKRFTNAHNFTRSICLHKKKGVILFLFLSQQSMGRLDRPIDRKEMCVPERDFYGTLLRKEIYLAVLVPLCGHISRFFGNNTLLGHVQFISINHRLDNSRGIRFI